MKLKDAETIQSGVQAGHELPYVADAAQRQEKLVKNRVFTSIQQGTLTPEQAYSAWHEVYSLHRMVRSLQSSMVLGQSVADANAEALKIG